MHGLIHSDNLHRFVQREFALSVLWLDVGQEHAEIQTQFCVNPRLIFQNSFY